MDQHVMLTGKDEEKVKSSALSRFLGPIESLGAFADGAQSPRMST
jgi:hypothetical protein